MPSLLIQPAPPAARPARSRRGFTMLEMMLSLAIFIVLGALLFSAFSGAFRVVNAEESILSLDAAGDRAVWEISRELLPAVIPVRLDSTAAKSDFGKLFNDRNRGFGAHGAAWREHLRRGTDCIAYTVPVDYDGDGDCLDADSLPELGIILPGAVPVAAASYTGKNNKLTGNIQPFLSALDPEEDLGLSSAPALAPDAARFSDSFTFPAQADRAYGLIRFVPKYEDGRPVVVSEADLDFDLNGDGELDDTYYLGRMELTFPNVTREVDVGSGTDVWGPVQAPLRRPLTGSVVLLPINQDKASWEPIFKLVRFSGSSAGGNSAVHDDSASAEGSYALRMRLHLFDPNYHARGNRAVPQITRKYETILQLRSMP